MSLKMKLHIVAACLFGVILLAGAYNLNEWYVIVPAINRKSCIGINGKLETGYKTRFKIVAGLCSVCPNSVSFQTIDGNYLYIDSTSELAVGSNIPVNDGSFQLNSDAEYYTNTVIIEPINQIDNKLQVENLAVVSKPLLSGTIEHLFYLLAIFNQLSISNSDSEKSTISPGAFLSVNISFTLIIQGEDIFQVKAIDYETPLNLSDVFFIPGAIHDNAFTCDSKDEENVTFQKTYESWAINDSVVENFDYKVRVSEVNKTKEYGLALIFFSIQKITILIKNFIVVQGSSKFAQLDVIDPNYAFTKDENIHKFVKYYSNNNTNYTADLEKLKYKIYYDHNLLKLLNFSYTEPSYKYFECISTGIKNLSVSVAEYYFPIFYHGGEIEVTAQFKFSDVPIGVENTLPSIFYEDIVYEYRNNLRIQQVYSHSFAFNKKTDSLFNVKSALIWNDNSVLFCGWSIKRFFCGIFTYVVRSVTIILPSFGGLPLGYDVDAQLFYGRDNNGMLRSYSLKSLVCLCVPESSIIGIKKFLSVTKLTLDNNSKVVGIILNKTLTIDHLGLKDNDGFLVRWE